MYFYSTMYSPLKTIWSTLQAIQVLPTDLSGMLYGKPRWFHNGIPEISASVK